MAAGLLAFKFEKNDAKIKYGGENQFDLLHWGRSLRWEAFPNLMWMEMKVNTIVSRYTGEVIFGSSTVPKYGFSFTASVRKKDSKEYEQLAGH